MARKMPGTVEGLFERCVRRGVGASDGDNPPGGWGLATQGKKLFSSFPAPGMQAKILGALALHVLGANGGFSEASKSRLRSLRPDPESTPAALRRRSKCVGFGRQLALEPQVHHKRSPWLRYHRHKTATKARRHRYNRANFVKIKGLTAVTVPQPSVSVKEDHRESTCSIGRVSLVVQPGLRHESLERSVVFSR